MKNLSQNFRYGLRLLARQPGFALIVALVLGLGIGANTTIFSLVNGALLRPFPTGDAERLVRLYEYDRARDARLAFAWPDFEDLRAESQTLGKVAAFNPASFALADGDRPELVQGALISPDLLQAFEVQTLAGRAFLAEEETPGRDRVVLLNEDLWNRRFGSDPGVVGRTLLIDGEPHSVVGVVESAFKFPVQSQIFKPLSRDPEAARGAHSLGVIGLMKPGTRIDQLNADLETFSSRLAASFPETNESIGARGILLRDSYVNRARTLLVILQVAVFMILLITCANIASLLLARGAGREREMAIRGSIGASRAHLVGQLLTECLLLSILGGVVGVLLTRFGVTALLEALPIENPYWMQFTLDHRVFAFAIVVSLLAGFVFGIVPALRNSKSDVSSVIKEGAAGSRGGGLARQRLFNGIVVAEVAITLVLLIAAGLLVKSFNTLQKIDPGLRPDGVLTLQIPSLPGTKYADDESVVNFYDRVLERVRALPGIDSAGANSQLPLRGRGGTQTYFIPEGMTDEDQAPLAIFQVVTPGYFETMGIPVVDGRPFDERDGLADLPSVLIVNRTAAERFWPGESAVGKRVRMSSDGEWSEIVGVVGDVKQQGLDRDTMLDYYAVQRDWANRGMTLVMHGQGDPTGLIAPVRDAIRAVDPDQPITEVQTMSRVILNSLWLQSFSTTVLFVLGGLALLLAVIGLYGVVSYSVSQRTQEIGVRMALGAVQADILKMMLKQSLKLVIFGLMVGLPLALMVNRLLARQLYGVGSMEIGAALLTVLVLTVVALFATLVPARRSMKVEPVTALRSE